MSADQNVRSVGRAISILECFTVDAPELTFADVAARSGLSKSTAHRLLGTLGHDRMIEFDDEKNVYRLGRGILRLGSVAVTGWDLLRHAGPVLTDVTQDTDETSLLFIPDGPNALCVRVCESSHSGRISVPAEGTQVPLNCGAAQRVLLAHLPDTEWKAIVSSSLQPLTRYSLTSPEELARDRSEIAQRGYALGWEDVSLHTCDVAAPVSNPKGEVVAAVSTRGIVQRFSAERLPTLIQGVMAAGKEISRRLSDSQASPDGAQAK